MSNNAAVLIVGAGPSGLVMACELARRKITFRIIDKNSGPTTTSNALAIHARSLEIWQQMGILEKALLRAHKIYGVSLYSGTKRLVHACFSQLPSPLAFSLCMPQSDTEQVLLERLAELGHHVERNQEVMELQQDAQGVKVKLSSGQSITADWLVACDGYHSVIREQCHIEYLGKETNIHFLMIDAKVGCELSPYEINLNLSPQGAFGMFPTKHFTRILAEVTRDPVLKALHQPSIEDFEKLAQQRCKFPLNISDLQWASGFWIHERLAQHFRHQRIFLVGDAAHAHSPAGGQGMNTGMQDAYNLAWKLALVINKKSHEELLETYEKERRPIAADVLKMSSRMTKLSSMNGLFMRIFRNHFISLVSKLSFVHKNFIKRIAELHIEYRHSSLSGGNNQENLHPGDRAPDAALNGKTLFSQMKDTRFILLNFSNNTLRLGRHEDEIKIIPISDTETAIRKKYHLQTGFCLIRPDGYIAFMGKNLASLKKYLNTWLL